ncbi:MAG TPA: aminotransferase class I/II-fold pyridoxal phosphate-dependent enzyme [Solirubrobacteraceae bacterium]|nr:aminotransferase class I/II-fold pyridoxal phosphate-dependent enzyme [Solirubrobacteraceae bacterium]
MDQEIANTLSELERKLRELEQVLRGIDQGTGDGDAGPRVAPAPPGPSPSISQARPGPAPGPSRLVDEAIEGTPRSPFPPRAASTDAPGMPSPTPSVPAPVSSAPSSPTPTPQQLTPSTPPAFPSPPAPRGRRPPPPGDRSPSAAELLRFRDRLERTARELTHDYDELLGRITYAAVPSQTGPAISFARGAPSLDIVDVEGLRDAAMRAFESDPGGTTAYGTSIGYPRLRAWIADRHGVEPERVLVTNGSMQADAFLFEALVRPGDDVVVERPTYDRTLLSLRERGATLHTVDLQADGLDTDGLARLLASGQARPRLAHIIPNFQNPAGVTLALAKRQALLALAAQHDFLVFEDDPYVALRFSGESLPTMLSMDPERVVYASSFSKTVCPGIRVGYLVGPTDLIGRIAKLATNTYISPNMVAQSIVYEFCASGAIERSIETVRTALAKRALTLAEALRRELPEAEFVQPEGGYFMWVTLPAGTDVAQLFDKASDLGVAFVKGTDFLLEGGENTLRLAYSGVTERQIEEGVERLAAAYRSL